VPRAGPEAFEREGFGRLQRDAYHFLLDASWPKLLLILVGLYLAANVVFALAYLLQPGAIENARAGSFADAFFFSVHTWTMAHHLTGSSPLHGATPDSVAADESEIIVSLVGLDSSLSQTVYARHTYAAADILFGARFIDVVARLTDGGRRVDLTRFHDVVEDPTCLPPWLTGDARPT